MKNFLQNAMIKFIIVFIFSAIGSHGIYAQTMMPLPPQSTTFSSMVRGYWFVAPVSFVITGLRMPPEAGAGLQHIQVSRINGAVAVWPTIGTNITNLFHVNNVPNGQLINTSIVVNAGDVIGILGTAGDVNSYATGPATSTIAGNTVTLNRFLYQGLLNVGPTTQYSSEPAEIGRIQMYYSVANCDTVLLPTAVNITAADTFICANGFTALTYNTVMPSASGLTYQWQQSNTLTGPWVNIGTASASTIINTPPSSVEKFYRCIAKCNNTDRVTSNVVKVGIKVPEIYSVQNGQHCGPGFVNLSASGNVNNNNHWFDVPVGGASLYMGDNFTTPLLTTSKTYYVENSSFNASGNGNYKIVGTGTGLSSTTNAGPFNQWYRRSTMQFLYTAAEIAAAGGSAGLINSLAFYCGTPSSYAFTNYTVKIKTVAATMTTLAWQGTGMTTVYNAASFQPVGSGWQPMNFTTPFLYNGIDNIVIELCWDYTAGGISSSGGNHQFTSKTGRFLYSWTDAAGTSCGLVGTSTSSELPNLRLEIINSCASPRVPVQAYIRDVPVINLGNDYTNCGPADQTLDLDAGLQDTASAYMWDNNSTQRYRTITNSGTYNVKVTTEFGCVSRDTISVSLLLQPHVDLGGNKNICLGETLTLDAGNEAQNYYWNNGLTTRTYDVVGPGIYSVIVSNNNGCTEADTIVVQSNGSMPAYQNIVPTNTGSYSFSFNVVNPQHIISYEWNFGDNSPVATTQSAMHTYATEGSYNVVLKTNSICGQKMDTIIANIFKSTGIDDVENNKKVSVYPNPNMGDEINIVTQQGLEIEGVEMYNILGQKTNIRFHKIATDVYKVIFNDAVASGTYTLIINANKGVITKKVQIIK